MESYNPHTNRDILTDNIEGFNALAPRIAEAINYVQDQHFAQASNFGLGKFDYGPERNLELYGSETAPL